MKMKKISAAALAAALLIGGVTTVFATSAAPGNNFMEEIMSPSKADEYDKVSALQSGEYENRTVEDVGDKGGEAVPEDERGIPGSREDYSSLLSLKTPDYKSISVADFNNSLLAWENDHEEASERIRRDNVMKDIRVSLTDEELSFVTLTFPVSNAQNTINVLYENYGTPKTNPIMQYDYTIDEPNVWYRMWYQLTIQIPDENKLTMGERDSCLSNVITQMQVLWNDLELDELAAMTEEMFKEKLVSLTSQNSNNLITISIKNFSFQGLDERSTVNN